MSDIRVGQTSNLQFPRLVPTFKYSLDGFDNSLGNIVPRAPTDLGTGRKLLSSWLGRCASYYPLKQIVKNEVLIISKGC